MSRSINLSGTAGKKYDLETLSTVNTRTSSQEELIVQIWYWNPNGLAIYENNIEEYEAHKKPDPPEVKVGQIWLSKWVETDFKGV